MKCRIGAVLLLGLLVSCGQAADMAEEAGAPDGIAAYGGASPPAAAEADAAARSQAPTQAVEGSASANTAAPAPTMYLAYAYQMGLELPAGRLSAIMDAHTRACQEAGPRLCQLIGSSRSGDPDSYLSGYVSLRGEPAWLRTFMSTVSSDTDAAGGRVRSQTTQTEDLTRQIVDTEARLRAATTLRDRLQTVLASRPGRVADLLEVERELARVQGEIDATQSNLAVMRTRVAMSELTLSYESAPRTVGSDTFEPLRDALANFLGIVVMGFAAIITLIAGLIPFAIVVGPIIWLLLRWRRRRGGRFFGRAAAAEPPPSG